MQIPAHCVRAKGVKQLGQPLDERQGPSHNYMVTTKRLVRLKIHKDGGKPTTSVEWRSAIPFVR
jgi:hypothetical protein